MLIAAVRSHVWDTQLPLLEPSQGAVFAQGTGKLPNYNVQLVLLPDYS